VKTFNPEARLCHEMKLPDATITDIGILIGAGIFPIRVIAER
jgi:hypothetical protein